MNLAEENELLSVENLEKTLDDDDALIEEDEDQQRDYIEKNLYDFYDIQLYAVVYIGSNK